MSIIWKRKENMFAIFGYVYGNMCFTWRHVTVPSSLHRDLMFSSAAIFHLFSKLEDLSLNKGLLTGCKASKFTTGASHLTYIGK